MYTKNILISLCKYVIFYDIKFHETELKYGGDFMKKVLILDNQAEAIPVGGGFDKVTTLPDRQCPISHGKIDRLTQSMAVEEIVTAFDQWPRRQPLTNTPDRTVLLYLINNDGG